MSSLVGGLSVSHQDHNTLPTQPCRQNSTQNVKIQTEHSGEKIISKSLRGFTKICKRINKDDGNESSPEMHFRKIRLQSGMSWAAPRRDECLKYFRSKIHLVDSWGEDELTSSQIIGEKKGELTIAQNPALQAFYALGSWGKAGNVYVQ